MTHRLTPLDHAQQAMVISANEGEPATITARGTHAELVAGNNAYRWALTREGSLEISN